MTKFLGKCILSIFLLPFLTAGEVSSQVNLKEGYILTSESDTIFGFIDFKADIRMSQFIDFYNPDKSVCTRFFPGQIRECGINNLKQYIYKEIIIDKIYGTTDSVFLEVLVDGRASLFVYHGRRTLFFIHRDSLGFMELPYQQIVNKNGIHYVDPHGKYLGVLRYYFSDCSFYHSNPPNCNFNTEALSREVRSYNSCLGQDTQITEKIKTPGYILNVGVRGGLGISRVDLSEYNKFPDVLNAPYNSKVGPSLGLFLEAKSKRWPTPLSLVFELNYIERGSSIPDNYSFYYSANEPDVSMFIDFNFAYLDGVLAAKYNLEFGKTSLFFKGGFLYGFGLNQENIIVQSSKTVYNKDNIFRTTYSNESGFVLSIGSTYNVNRNSALGIELRFEHSSAIPASRNNPLSNNSLIAALTYHLGTN